MLATEMSEDFVKALVSNPIALVIYVMILWKWILAPMFSGNEQLPTDPETKAKDSQPPAPSEVDQNNKPNVKGFSLTELLVGVAFLGLLFVGLTVLTSCKESAVLKRESSSATTPSKSATAPSNGAIVSGFPSTTATAKSALLLGSFAIELPEGWQQVVGEEADQAKSELEEGMRGMMARYAGETGNEHRFGMKDFAAVRVPDKHGWLLAYSLQIPDQEDYYATVVRDNEQKFAWGKQQGIVTNVRSSGVITLRDGKQAFKNDIDMKAGYRQLQVTYWSKDEPGHVSIVQLLLEPRATGSQTTAGVHILDSLRTGGGIPEDPQAEVRSVVEGYFNHYMKARLDAMLAILHPKGPMYPSEKAIAQLRSSAAGNAIQGEANVLEVKEFEIKNDVATARLVLKMRADTQRNGTFRDEVSQITVEMRQVDGRWRVWKIAQ